MGTPLSSLIASASPAPGSSAANPAPRSTRWNRARFAPVRGEGERPPRSTGPRRTFLVALPLHRLPGNVRTRIFFLGVATALCAGSAAVHAASDPPASGAQAGPDGMPGAVL